MTVTHGVHESQPVILIIGGAGYIGSHMVNMLLHEQYHTIVLDNCISGHRDAVFGGEFYIGHCGDAKLLSNIFSKHDIIAVMHFGGLIQVGESVQEPLRYYQNNTNETAVLLEVMQQHNVKHLIFSSTAAVYGEPHYTPIDTQHPLAPINPYGKSKWMVERMIQDCHYAYGLNYTILRYFNAAGADPEGRLGECHEPESHLIPLALQAISGRGKALSVFGRDYDTPDGTCVRDYIHVVDLCSAHLSALQQLIHAQKSGIYNLGNGNGFSVQEVLASVERVTGKKVPIQEAPRRAGDAAVLVADATHAKKELGWKPQYSDLDTIVQHAWAWEQKMFSYSD